MGHRRRRLRTPGDFRAPRGLERALLHLLRGFRSWTACMARGRAGQARWKRELASMRVFYSSYPALVLGTRLARRLHRVPILPDGAGASEALP